MQEINEAKLRELLEEEKTIHPMDDERRLELSNKLLYYCGDNESDIVLFFSTLDSYDLGTMSSIFEDISEKLNKSKTFKRSLEEITSKYPDVNFNLEYC
ncbi:MAG: hypothetical protein NC320_08790 [Clostridium sp.]|nr:hypothetical protein [Clostridium sp.]